MTVKIQLNKDEINKYNKFIFLWNQFIESSKSNSLTNKISDKVWSIFFDPMKLDRLKFMKKINESEIELLNENNIKSWLKLNATIKYVLTLKYLYKRYHQSAELSYEYFIWKMTKFYFNQYKRKINYSLAKK